LEVTLLDSRTFAEAGVGERFARMAAAISGSFSSQDLAGFGCLKDLAPEVTGPPGLRALVDPDGVTVRVFGSGESPDAVGKMVMLDMVERHVRPKVEGMVSSGATPEEVGVAVFQLARVLKPRYRVERLGGDR
jgi:hypothetical protein